jgi:phosphoribosyl-dephospho-CoA transferase
VRFGSPAPTHNLLRVRDPITLTIDDSAPEWVRSVLRQTPWVVVRRGYLQDGSIPVGVRGTTRTQRFATLLAIAEIAEQVSPEELTDFRSVLSPTRRDAVPALAALARIAPLLERRRYRWGPGGSVGFELATGASITTASSDLDVILRKTHRLESDEVSALRAALVEAAAPARIDVLLETPHGGVSLADLAARPTHVLVRTPHGARLVVDPWKAGTSSAPIKEVP